MNSMTLDDILSLVKDDMAQVNVTILKQLNSDVMLINQLGQYLIAAGGKRIRPMVSLLTAKALNYTSSTSIVNLAALVEFIHNATLLHDDVVDESELRRGKPTANMMFGNAASVLVGDFIYTRAFQMMTELDSLHVLRIMSDATNVIAEGEIQQLINCNNPSTSEDDYMRVIYSKTARLFEASSHVAAVLAGANREQELAFKQYGCYLGTAFQLIDDLLDYSAADDQQIGKSIGDDLEEGKPTLPLIHALHHANSEEKKLITHVIEHGEGRHHLGAILTIMNKCDSLAYTQKRAEEEAQKAMNALSCIPSSIYCDALISLAKLSVQRKY